MSSGALASSNIAPQAVEGKPMQPLMMQIVVRKDLALVSVE